MSIQTLPVSNCMVCHSSGESKYLNLDDRVFGVSKGWNIWECTSKECGLLWLNPMPSKKDIGMAYESYYTHSNPRKPIIDFSFLEKPYLSVRYNYFSDMPLWNRWIGYLVYLIPVLKNKFDFGVLYLSAVKNGRILDFGCGNGWIMDNLRQCGWDCYGLDFDKKAVEFCQSKGLKVNLGDIPSQNHPDDFFDAIIVNHVIEHVHEVDELLLNCYLKLKKNGRLIITTPNIENWQHRLYGRNWFQLDPPRHLHLFHIANLEKVVKRNNFSIVQSFSSIRMDAWSTIVTRGIKRNGRFIIGKDKKKFSDLIIGIVHQHISHILKIFNRKAAGEIVLIATKK